MGIKKSWNGSSIRKPGAYSISSQDKSGGAPLGSNGTILLVGESSIGAPGAVSGIQRFTSAQMGALVSMYGSGPIVDCAVAAVNPAKSSNIGGADTLLIWKTNAALRAQLQLQNATPANLLLLQAAIYGQPGNYLTASVAAGTDSAKQRIITIKDKKNVLTEVLPQNAAQAQLSIHYIGAGSAATMTIAGASDAAKTLTTSVTGTSGENLNITLASYAVKDLVDFLNNFGGGGIYSATLLNTATGTIVPSTDLDPVSAIDVKTAATSLYRLQLELVDIINENSQLVIASKNGMVAGLPAVSSETYLSGGAVGASANSDFAAGLAKSLSEDYGVGLACISQDATADITSGLTDPSSTYTISSVLAAMESHMRLRGKIKTKKEAQYVGGCRLNTKAAFEAQAQSLGSELGQLWVQDMLVSDLSGNLVWKQPHVGAAMIAGIRLGTDVGTPLTHKFLNCSGIGHFVNASTGISAGDFDPSTDYDEAIDAGVTFAENFKGAFRVVVDNTTYGIDQSFVFNRGSVVEASQYVAKTLRETAELVFVGNKVAGGQASSMRSILRNKLIELNKPEVNIITSSSDAPKGFVEKTFTVQIQGNTAYVAVEIKPVQGMDFVLIEFTLGDIQQSA